MSGENKTPVNNSGLNPEDYKYYSPRDVDHDGRNDVIDVQTRDGQTQTHHLDDQGEIVLTEIDTDGDGILETTVKALDEKTNLVQQDKDKDGEMDTAKVVDTKSGATIQQDTLENGKVTETRIDSDGDGKTDTQLIDSDHDGAFDTAIVDSDQDGVPNSAYIDTDGDGSFDIAKTDADNGDGILETEVTSGEVGGSLGEMSNFTDHIHYRAGDTSGDPSTQSDAPQEDALPDDPAPDPSTMHDSDGY